MAFARYPAALPCAPGAFPPSPPGGAFTLLREGDAWLHAEHNLLLAVERLVPCGAGLVPQSSYGVHNFHGFRGEPPGQEAARRADYTGYAGSMRCLQLRVVTGVTAAPGMLPVSVRMQGLDADNRLVLGGEQVRRHGRQAHAHNDINSRHVTRLGGASAYTHTCMHVSACPQCGFPLRPRLRLLLPAGVDIISIVWRNNRNQTVGLDTPELQLPPLAPLAEASAQDSERCNTACDFRYRVSAVALCMSCLAPEQLTGATLTSACCAGARTRSRCWRPTAHRRRQTSLWVRSAWRAWA
jgi:hypothetical protein